MSAEFTPWEFRSLWPEFEADSWAPWASLEDVIFGAEPADSDLVERVTGRTELPTEQVPEAWIVAGRGAGKSRFVARLAVYFAAGRAYRRAPGEQVYVGVFAPDRKQAGVTFRYVVGLLRAVPALERLIARELRESVELANGVTIEVITASKAAPRGRSYALAIVEEAAFLPADDSADPDRELLRALRPALARVPGSLLAVVSSPYARRGELWRVHRDHFGKNDSPILVVQADTRTLNPSFPQAEIARAFSDDPIAAAAEYGAEFRSDVDTFVRREVLEASVIPGRHELPPGRNRYLAFVDPSGGSADSFTMAIGHHEKRAEQPVAIVDAVRETRPPFSPEATVAEYAALLRTYRVTRVTGDRYAGEWPREAFRRHGITYELAEKPKSDLYRDVLAFLNSGRVELLDNDRLVAQLAGLERRTARGGRDSIDHGPGGHDDLANAVAGLAVALIGKAARPGFRAFDMDTGELVHGTDADGNEWRDRRPWNGTFLDYDRAGRPIYETTFRDGQLVEGRPLIPRREDAQQPDS